MMIHGYLWQLFFEASRNDFMNDEEYDYAYDKEVYLNQKITQLIQKWYVLGSVTAILGELLLVWYVFK